MLKIYNTLTKTLEEFKPINKDLVSFYQCGPTVYWTQHIGNMRAMVMSDLIRRSLEYSGYKVKFVRNYTDVGHLTGDNDGNADSGEDKMEKGAKREGLTPEEIANKYIQIFETHTSLLNILEPTSKPKATEYIDEMIAMVKTLLDKGYAYVTPKAVYFDVKKFAKYNDLNRQNLEANIEGAGHGDEMDIDKNNKYDFALWFFKTGSHKNALQTWVSPFESSEVKDGRGFPGWHIECSAMIKALLGDTIDIHMGGIEHIAVHHTNEIAQSESANGVKFVNYWLHNEHLLMNNEKMSKSLGNVYDLDGLIAEGYKPEHIRYFFLQAHYRSKQNFTKEGLESAKNSYNKLLNHLINIGEEFNYSYIEQFIDQEAKEKFIEAIGNDFNIPQALAVVWELLKTTDNSQVQYSTILNFDKVLGLKLEENIKNLITKVIPQEILDIQAKINSARQNKQYDISDKLREELKNKFNYEIIFNQDGSSELKEIS